MGLAFQGFRGSITTTGIIWQEHDSLFPYKCDQCHREFKDGGKRFIASSLNQMSHNSAGCRCEDCHKGADPNRRKAPVYSERRTELD